MSNQLECIECLNLLLVMIEAGAALVIAFISGTAVLTQRVHNRISDLDRRVDKIELSVAQNFVSKSDLSEIMARVDAHMSRIEDKLDRIAFVNQPPKNNGT
jgi:hypothetical protein